MGVNARKRNLKTNPELKRLVAELYGVSARGNAPVWRAVAVRLEGPVANRPVINLDRLNRLVKDGESVIVPGKVLGNGNITKKITISAYSLSSSARTKLEKAGCKIYDIEDLVKSNPGGSGLRLMA
ncbi:MAG: 50S ribosomal protein L18e [Thermoplasmata archaeon]|uniref:Large ribosomal subunit protein eL18 n=1 Tax=Candidatus Sysuiplasma superficiale TaxID=2823368 RepID=A0A8J7YQL9_9ARCH|nr:50S ribosomal protein L18e [Candidatus Sysuiplasma superficiale]MBX8645018.1 50S ribosomal protein L18e [Candidatus Sysuiplasma superficiale]MCL4346377.1 50S ribosomal protein L18e [Candidatus Thermoplasmatota archaeon]MCL5437383.1 50S ribosomal protein L18e [Candidatus Thermoplasmatota archaeon]